MSEITSAAVDAARLYKEIKNEVISEIMTDIKPAMNNLHFGGFVFFVNDGRQLGTRLSKVSYELKMKLNGNEKTLRGTVDYEWDTMPKDIGAAIFQHVLETVKNNVYDACVPIINRQLNIQDNR